MTEEEEVGEVMYSREGGKQEFTANSEFFGWNNAKFEDGGYFDGAIPNVSTYMSTYAKGGEIAKAEILGLSKNIMGTTDIEMKISGMRKPQRFSVYPIGKDDTDKIITIQSETRIGKIKLIEKLENETLEQQCKRVLVMKQLDNYYDSYEEAIMDCNDKYIIHNNNVYEVIEDREQEDCDIFEANSNADGTISYTISYYNGGCCFNEAIGRSLKKLNRQ